MNNKKTFWTTVAGVSSTALAFLGIVNCCGMPFLAGILAALGIGASQLAIFAEYHGWFVGLAVLFLLMGFYQSYFRKGGCCKDGERKSRSVIIQRVFLWLGAVIVAILLFVGSGEETKAQDACCPAQPITECCGE